MFGCLMLGLGRAKLGLWAKCAWGCSSVVERLVRNQKVASSSLVSSTLIMMYDVQCFIAFLGLSDREDMVVDGGKQRLCQLNLGLSCSGVQWGRALQGHPRLAAR